jgi:hypothetical protein
MRDSICREPTSARETMVHPPPERLHGPLPSLMGSSQESVLLPWGLSILVVITEAVVDMLAEP